MRLAFFRTLAIVGAAGVLASPAIAQHPRLLKRHGVVYGVRGIDIMPGCKGAQLGDLCEPYAVSGTIEEVGYYMNTQKISDFTLRMKNGRRKIQNVDPWDFPRGAYALIRPGHRVHIVGTLTGMGQIANVDTVILVGR